MQTRWAPWLEDRACAAWTGSSIRRFSEQSPRAALLLAALLAASFSTAWLLLQAPNFLSGFDFMRMHFFYKAYFREAVAAGRLPLWNPFVGLGRPFMADIETASLYPPNLLVLPFGVYGGVALMVLLHQALAIYGGVRLGQVIGASPAAGWIVGAGVALAGPFSARLSVGIVEGYFTLCWMPALLWLAARLQDGWDRRLGAAFAVSVALSILAGQPPLLYVVILGLLVFVAARQSWPGDAAGRRRAGRNLLGLAATGLLGAGLAAIELLPFLELVGQGNRPLMAPGFAVANGMPPASWLSLITPASDAFAPNWEYDLHCGLVPLFAAACGLCLWRDRNGRALLAMGGVGALLAAGDRSPVLGWFVHVFPGAAALRIPSRYGILFAVGLLGLGSLALTRRIRRPALFLAPVFLAGAGLVVWLKPYLRTGPGRGDGFVLADIAALAAAAILVGLWQARDRLPRGSRAVGCLLWVFCGTNWFWAVALQSPVYSAYGFRTDEKAVHAALLEKGLLRQGAPPPRIAFSPADLCENAGMTEGFSTYNSYVAPSLRRTWGYVHAAAGVRESTTDFIRMPAALGADAERWGSLNLVAALSHPSRELVFEANPDPRAYIAFDIERVADAEEAEARMEARGDFHRRALVEAATAPAFVPAGGAASGRAEIVRFSAERVVVRASASSPGILVLAEAWYPGWEATVSGRPSRVFPVNGWMRAVLVPAGESEVVLHYHSRFLAAGAAASAVSALVLAVLCAGWTSARGRPEGA